MEAISFHCPACGKSLRVPASAAGQRGPCPSCREDIIGPQPALGIPARVSLSSSAPFSSTPFPSPAPKTPQEPAPEPPTPAPAPEPIAQEPEETPPLPFSAPPAAKAELPIQEAPTSPQPAKSQPQAAPPPSGRASPPPSSSNADSSRRLRHLWTAVFVLSCILCTLIAFFAGYLTALYRHQPTAPIFHSATSPSPPSPRAANPPAPAPSIPPLAPEPTPAPEDDPSRSSEEGATTPRTAPEPEPLPEPEPQAPPSAELDSPPASLATLEAFLSAPDWAARLAYVDNDPELHARMKKADEEGESPELEVLEIQPTLLDPEFHHYLVKTKTLPNGFPATLRRTEDGWLIAWDAFHEFSTNRLARFLKGELGQTGTFRALIRPIESKQEHFATYEITNPIDRSTTICYANRTDGTSTQWGGLPQPDQHRESPLTAGSPARVDISQEKTKAGGNYILLKYMALGW